MILHNVSKIAGSERTLEKTTPLLHCLQNLWALFGTNLIVSSQTLNFKMHYFINWWIFLTECWCNGLFKCVPFTYQKKNLGYRYTLTLYFTGGGQFDPPPCMKSATASRPPQITTRLFITFFFQVLRIFWYQVCENRTVGREVTWRFVLARGHKICPKSAFCIGLCTKHMEITDFLKMH